MKMQLQGLVCVASTLAIRERYKENVYSTMGLNPRKMVAFCFGLTKGKKSVFLCVYKDFWASLLHSLTSVSVLSWYFHDS